MTPPETTPRPRWISRSAARLIALLLIAGVIGAVIASRPTSDPEQLAAQAQRYVREFKYEDALRTAEDALQIVRNGGYPPEYVAKFHLLRGQMWHAVYEWDFALTDFNSAIELAPDYPEAYYLRGTFFAGRSELDSRWPTCGRPSRSILTDAMPLPPAPPSKRSNARKKRSRRLDRGKGNQTALVVVLSGPYCMEART